MNAPQLFPARDGALFSPCRTWRYRLTRQLGGGRRIANIIMVNPSTADELANDRSVNRCIGFARASWGCAELIVSNLFAFVATQPIDMLAAADPVGPKNMDYVIGAACRAHESGGPVIAAWGINGGHRDQNRIVMSLLTQTLGIPVQCLGTTAKGFPRHPLYLAKDTPLEPFNGRPLKGA